MPSEKITFTNKDGQNLSARMELPASGKPRAFALFAHCFTCSKDLTAVQYISRTLTQANIAVMRFDFTGLGESEGDFSDTNFSSNVADLVEAAQYLSDRFEGPKILIGHSLGGAAVLLAAHHIDSTEAVVTIGAPADPQHVIKNFEAELDKIEETGTAKVTLAGRSFTIKKQFIDDLEDKHMAQTIKELKKPLLIFHSPQDKIVGIENAERIYKQAMHPKSFVSLDGASHLLTKKQDAAYVGQVIAAWATRYVALAPPTDLETDQQVVASIGTEKYTTAIKAGQHYLVGDEPKSSGGQDLGPSPYGFLNAALGSCTAMTLRMYADRKEWPLERVDVHLSHKKIHAEDCADCETKEGKVDQIIREVEVVGDLDNKQRERLLEIANKCPVHRTLTSEINVKSRLRK